MSKTMKKESLKDTLLDFSVGNNFLDSTPKHRQQKQS